MCIFLIILASGFFLEACRMDCGVNLTELKILQSEKVEGLKKDLPLQKYIRIDFLNTKRTECALVEMYIYTIKNNEDRHNMISNFGKDYTRFFDMRATAPLVHLRHLEIYNDHDKNNGLGKQLFLYTLITLQNRYPQGVYFWKAVAFDGRKYKAKLFRFYQSFGAKLVQEYETSALFYIDLAKLNLGLFKPKREMSEFLSVETRLL